MSNLKRNTALTTVAAGAAFSNAANAGPITVLFDGTITEVGPNLNGGDFQVGNQITIGMEYDHDSPDFSSFSEVGYYSDFIANYDITSGSFSASGNDPRSILSIFDTAGSPTLSSIPEGYSISFIDNDGSLDISGSYELQSFSISSNDNVDSAALMDFANELGSINASSPATGFLAFQDPATSNFQGVNFSLDEAYVTHDVPTTTPVDSPSSVILLCTGLVGWALLNKFKSDKPDVSTVKNENTLSL